MYRNEAVKLMSDMIDSYNRSQGAQQGLPMDQLEQYISQGRPQLDLINGMLYDLLKENGVIA
jgi:hypothetical protein